MSDLNLGQIIKDGEQVDRDAIHVAVAPVEANRQLKPGTHVGLVGGLADWNTTAYIGIVDPYLTSDVAKGERFWLFLYPKTITNLRHHWSHPAFEGAAGTTGQHLNSSQLWIRSFAESVGLSYDDLMAGAKTWLDYEDYMCRGSLLEGYSVPDEFWTHYEAVTGVKGSGSFFTCSC